MKHTKGPWKIQMYLNYVGYSIYGQEHGCLAERWYPSELDAERNEEMRANAHLISAAPEMYEALRNLYEVAQGLCDDPIPLSIRMEVEAAIAKAEQSERSSQ